MTRPQSRPTLALSLALLLVLALAAAPARALVDYTDTWWAAAGAEPGWGVNFTQQNRFLYGTFYVYGPDGKAVWYSAQLSRVGETETYSGGVYRITGTWFGAPVWAGYDIGQVGSATFTASTAFRGVLTWNVEGTAMTKNIERLAAAEYVPVEGVYIGGVSGTFTASCVNSTFSPQPVQVLVTRSTANVIKLEFRTTSIPSTSICVMEGQGRQYGRMWHIASATYVCGTKTYPAAEIPKLQKLDDGVEFGWRVDHGSGCIESGRVAAVRQ
jgi:hypothetical protein